MVNLVQFEKGFRLLTMVVSAMEPKLLMNMLQETLTGGPGMKHKASEQMQAQNINIVVKQRDFILGPEGGSACLNKKRGAKKPDSVSSDLF